MQPDPDHLPKPVLTIIHRQELTEELAWALCDPFSEYRRGLVPRSLERYPTLGEARREMRERLASDWEPLGFMESVSGPPVVSTDHTPPHHFVLLQHRPPRFYKGDPAFDTDPRLQRHLDFPLFQKPRFQYFQVSPFHTGSPLDLNHAANSDWLLDRLQLVVDLLEADYAFCVDGHFEFSRPEIGDPRAFPWDLTYFGPELAASLGHEALERSPARHVWSDHRGGHWVQLNEMPFIPMRDEGGAREALARHLGLGQRFGA